MRSRNIVEIIAVSWMMGTTGCGNEPLVAPEDFQVVVQIVPAAQVFGAAEDVGAILTNRSSGTVYMAQSCLPELERLEGANWSTVVLPTRIACTAEARPPQPVKPGEQVSLVLSRSFLTRPLPPGTYRFKILIGKADWSSFAPRYSLDFAITD